MFYNHVVTSKFENDTGFYPVHTDCNPSKSVFFFLILVLNHFAKYIHTYSGIKQITLFIYWYGILILNISFLIISNRFLYRQRLRSMIVDDANN